MGEATTKTIGNESPQHHRQRNHADKDSAIHDILLLECGVASKESASLLRRRHTPARAAGPQPDKHEGRGLRSGGDGLDAQPPARVGMLGPP